MDEEQGDFMEDNNNIDLTTMELTDKEKNLVALVEQLAQYADDDSTTQEVIDGMVDKIRDTTNESIQQDLQLNDDEDVGVMPVPQIPRHMNNDISARMMHLGGGLQTPQSSSNMLLFTRIREVKQPGKAHPTDAGIDFYVPDERSWTEEFKRTVENYSRNSVNGMIEFKGKPNEPQRLVVKPSAHVAIPAGVKTIIPPGYGMMFVNKSGVATKLKLAHSACLIDSEYRGEIIMCFFNHGIDDAIIEPGMKIAQGLIVPIVNMDIKEVLNCVYDDIGAATDRGGGFGSSGTH